MAEAATDGTAGQDRLLNPAARIRVMPIGRSAEPVVVVDDALTDPEKAVGAAAALAFAPADEGRGGFPGIRAKAPFRFASALARGAMPLIESVFGLAGNAMSAFDASFSIVTAAPQTLHPMQRIPHIDTRDPRRVAILLYLGRSGIGGTAFFRQDSTGLEQVGPEQFDAYGAARRADLARLTTADGYPDRSTPGYTETAHFEGRFNRLLIYRSCSLHSGILPAGSELSADPRRGRLTANIFVDFTAA